MVHLAILSLTQIEQQNLTSAIIDADRVYLSKFDEGGKRWRESCAWRGMLRVKLREWGFAEDAERAIEYSEVGAPYLVGSAVYFNVSHCATHVAIVVSEEAPCSVDIESTERDFERVRSRYVTAEESAMGCKSVESERLLPLIWSAKEALYKVSGLEGLDLLRDITITNIDSDAREISGLIAPLGRSVTMRYTLVSGCVVVHTI